MKNIFRYLLLFIGCLIIALSYNFFIIPNNLISFGVDGISNLLYYKVGVHPAINLFIINMIFILMSLTVLKKETIRDYLIPSILIPILVYLTSFLTSIISIDLPELILVILVSSFLNGIGYSMIYKQGFFAGATFLFEEMLCKITRFNSKLYSWIIDIILIVVATVLYGYQIGLYSLIIIFITKYMITKERFGINNSKVFYIITSKENEVKEFIINELGSELSILDIKGGFSKKKNTIILSVVPTEDFFKLKEGIKIIDPNAFIAITDTYDVINRKSF